MMSPIPTPIMREVDYEKSLYYGPAMAQLRILKQQMAISNLKIGSRTVDLGNGVTCFCNICFNLEEVFITIKKADEQIVIIPLFLSHPRSGNLRKMPYWDNTMNSYTLTGVYGGGWREDKTEIENRHTYPLTDNDNGTFCINNKAPVMSWSEPENYGNVWWISPEFPVLSWRGPPNGFSISSVYDIPGLSQLEKTVNDKPFYTVFGCYIYASGARLCHGPQDSTEDEMLTLVIGACYTKDLNGKTWLIAVTITNLETFTLKIRKSDNLGSTWSLLHSEPASTRAKTTAYISASGKKIIHGNSVYTISDHVDSCSKEVISITAGTGTRVVVGTGGYRSSYTYSGSKSAWMGMAQSESFVENVVTVAASFTNTGSGDSDSKTKDVPVYRGNPATGLTVRRGAENTNVNCEGAVTENSYAVFTAIPGEGSWCSVDWSGVDCVSKDKMTALKIVPDCNQSYSVTATLQPQGVSTTLEREKQDISMSISGPTWSGNYNSPGIGAGQYNAVNAYGTVAWAVSCGTISEGGYANFTGCGCPQASATVTATDECGRSASITVTTATSGYWVSNNDNCCIKYEDVPLELRQYVFCNEYQCYGTCVVSGGTKTCYSANPGWGYNYNSVCSGCGPMTTTNRSTMHWECP